MEIEYFKEKIEKLNSDKEYKDFAMEILSQTIPWFFQEKFKTDAPSQYSKFKLYISKKFKVSPNDVALGGSSWLGFSLSPNKNFRNFNKESDIDIVVEFQGSIREDFLFNVAHEDEFLIGDVLLDINPIKKEKSGTLKDYIEKMR